MDYTISQLYLRNVQCNHYSVSYEAGLYEIVFTVKFSKLQHSSCD